MKQGQINIKHIILIILKYYKWRWMKEKTKNRISLEKNFSYTNTKFHNSCHFNGSLMIINLYSKLQLKFCQSLQSKME